MSHTESTTSLERGPNRSKPLKVYTLGRFTLVLDNHPIHFRGKVQKRPLELLKALIALGGRQVSSEKLCEALWPDAEGDAAHTSLHTTLHRLRKLIGSQAIVLQNGHVSLNDHYCWSDVVAFERQLSRLDRLCGAVSVQASELESELETARGLYQGHFLGKDHDYVWAFALRDTLRVRWLRSLRRCINVLAQQRACQAVQYWYQTALELNPGAEDLYQELMNCLAAQGQRAEALRVYERCCFMLRHELGMTPSDKTTALYERIKQGEVASCERHCPLCDRTQGMRQPSFAQQN